MNGQIKLREYKSLSFSLTPQGEVNSSIKDFKSRASSVLYQLKRKLGENFKKYPDITMGLFKALVEPIILHMADFWGCLKPAGNNPYDTTKFLKFKTTVGSLKSLYSSLHRNLVHYWSELIDHSQAEKHSIIVVLFCLSFQILIEISLATKL